MEKKYTEKELIFIKEIAYNIIISYHLGPAFFLKEKSLGQGYKKSYTYLIGKSLLRQMHINICALFDNETIRGNRNVVIPLPEGIDITILNEIRHKALAHNDEDHVNNETQVAKLDDKQIATIKKIINYFYTLYPDLSQIDFKSRAADYVDKLKI